ncbi:MAG: DUF3343 domain-containing protein [Selenomonadaceae bacterium]|nr:DUF3343 domain-containing protein [Selenomonadaceae bacterium]
MREKELRFVVTFHTTAEAMAVEKLCREKAIEGKLISAPRSISADCGIAWSSPPELADIVREAVQSAGIEIQGFHEVRA